MSDISKWSPKDPNDIADYWIDWGVFLPADVNITAATVTVPEGVTKVGDEDFTGNIVRVRFGDGTVVGKYPIDCLIQTDSGETFEITKTLEVKERIKT